MAEIIKGVVILANDAKWVESRNRWQINVQEDGERKTFTSSVKGKKGQILAQEKAKKWILDKNSNKDGRFQNYYKLFLEQKAIIAKDGVKSEDYIKHEQMGRLYLIPNLKHKRLTSITDQDWQNCINSAFKKKNLSKKSLKNIRGSITAFIKFVRKQGIKIDYPEDLEIPKGASVGTKIILQPQDIHTLFNNDTITRYRKEVPCFFIHAFRFIAITGLRRGELCFAKKSHIKNNIFHVEGSLNRLGKENKGKTKNAQRYFALTSHMNAVLADQSKMLKEKGIISPYVFCDESGGKLDPNHLYKMWLVYRKQHGIQSNIHELRHTFISIAEVDLPKKLLKSQVGHGDKTPTSKIYSHKVDGEAQKTADILEKTFDKYL